MRERWLHHHGGDRLSAFLDDELSELEALEVTRHLAVCGRCLAELEEIRAARAALRDLPRVEPPASVLFDPSSLVMHTSALRATRGVRYAAMALAGAVALTAAVFAAGAEEPGTVTPPLEMFVIDHVLRTRGGPMLTPVDLGSSGR